MDMKSWVIDLLVCFHCRKDTQFELLPIKVSGDEVIEGNLLCPSCKREYPIASQQFEQAIMDRDYFDDLADSFRSPHLWMREGKNWHLRQTVWHDVDCA